MNNVNRCKEMDDAISEAFTESLPEDHPAYQPSACKLEQEEYAAILSMDKANK